jgi:DNA-binding MarR family transcriptional regulator
MFLSKSAVVMETWKEKLLALLRDKRLTGSGLKILLLLYASVEYGSFAPITPARIARLLGTQESSVKRSIKGLVENGIVNKRYESGKLVGYEIVEFFAYNATDL